jgi:hypothetical protein
MISHDQQQVWQVKITQDNNKGSYGRMVTFVPGLVNW